MTGTINRPIQLCYNCKRQVDPDVGDPEKADDWLKSEELHKNEGSVQKIIAGALVEIKFCPICSELLNSDKEFDVVDYDDDEA